VSPGGTTPVHNSDELTRIEEIPSEWCFLQCVNCARGITPPQNNRDNDENAAISVRELVKFSGTGGGFGAAYVPPNRITVGSPVQAGRTPKVFGNRDELFFDLDHQRKTAGDFAYVGLELFSTDNFQGASSQSAASLTRVEEGSRQVVGSACRDQELDICCGVSTDLVDTARYRANVS
jgi:hypothetical protein